MEETRTLELRKGFAIQDIIRLIELNDVDQLNTFLVLNGGTGVGKTTAIMEQVQAALDKKCGRPQTMLVVESRSATVEQLRHRYDGVDVCQRKRFMGMIEQKQVDYDWVVLDECHGLFSEANFADDAVAIGDWIREERGNTHIIFITANDEYFEELSRQYFSDDYHFIYLFPDFTKYVSHTYVKEIQFIKTNKVDNAIQYVQKRFDGQKGIIFLKKASDVKKWFFDLLAQGARVAMVVSRANETNISLSTKDRDIAKDAMLNLSGGESGLTMADLCHMLDTIRIGQGKEGVRAALEEERLPADIDILLATDTLQEGVSIHTPINYIIIEGYTEVEVRQKLGRFRGNLDQLYIIFNPVAAYQSTHDKLETFTKLVKLYQDGDQMALAQFYGWQQGAKSKTLFLTKRTLPSGEFEFRPNEKALLAERKNFKTYTRLMSDTENAVTQLYSFPLLEGKPKIVTTDTMREENYNFILKSLIEKWKGIPLKGSAQVALIQDLNENGILDRHRKPITNFVAATRILKGLGAEFETKKATKKDLEVWPQYLTKVKEEYKVWVGCAEEKPTQAT